MSARLLWIVLISVIVGVVFGSAVSWTLRQPKRTTSFPAPQTMLKVPPAGPTGRLAVPPLRPAAQSGPGAAQPVPDSNSAAAPAEPPVHTVPSQKVVSKGPFEIDGVSYSLKINRVCGKFDEEKQRCTDNYGGTADSFSIVDSAGNIQFQKKFSLGGNSDNGSLEVSGVRVEGHAHQSLQVITSETPSAPNAGDSSDFFALHNGKLVEVAENIPVGDLDNLPVGRAESSRKLPQGDIFSVTDFGALYYKTVYHLRFNWNEGRLDQLETNEFDVVPHQGEHPQDSAVDFYPSPDFKAKPLRVHLGPETKIVIRKAVRTVTSVDASGKKVVTEWLRITIDGRQGYISGDADFGAIGLDMVG